jgi:DNA repair exonuclease SbcCD ATPase subunit
VREGQEQGTIALRFLSPVDDRSYEVVRQLGRDSSLKIFDGETGRSLCRSTRDAEFRLPQLTGWNLGKYAPVLFNDAVAVPQGKMTGIFLEQPAPRKAVFDPLMRVKEYKDAYDNLLETQNALKEKISGVANTISGLKGELARLPVVEADIADLEGRIGDKTAEQEDLRKSLEAWQVELEVLDETHSHIEGLERRQEILNSQYALTVRCRGEKRSFKQMSGGEQMAAAIAVRLAVLLQMSQVRLLFLDEPTANLDDERRDRLADRITRLEGLQQIFVITHDDAFQRETHHLVHLTRENGASRVEVR